MFTVLLSAVVACAIGAVLAWWVENRHSQAERAVLEKSNGALLNQWTEARDGLEQARTQLAAKDAAIARLEERSQAERRVFEEMRSSLPDTFKSLASEILEEKSKTFAEQNQTSLGHLLEPLKSRLKDFQDKMEAAHLEQVRGGAALHQQVSTLVASNTKISEEANHLAEALKGSSKTQGTWGELILERVLEGAGLRKGQEYESQESYSTENGRRAQPDVVIHLPGDRHLVVDSKVSLVDYEAYCNAGTDAARSAALHGHMNSVRTHIKELAEKNYQTLYGLNSLDFVIMFLPIEPAFTLALSRDDKLWERAWQRNVLLASPSTLLFDLRTVAYLWRQEQQKRNVEEIARRGADLYNKLAGFVSDLEEIGERLRQAQKGYDGALAKLSTGRGNVIRQAEMLKSLGVKPSKQLPQGLVELAQQEALELEEAPVEPETGGDLDLPAND